MRPLRELFLLFALLETAARLLFLGALHFRPLALLGGFDALIRTFPFLFLGGEALHLLGAA